MAALRPEHFDDGTFGAWVLKCDPAVYNVSPEIHAGYMDGMWTVNERMTSRLALMGADQPAFFWMSTGSDEFSRGFWGAGWLEGTVEKIAPSEIDPTRWDPDALKRQTRWVAVSVDFFPVGILADRLKVDPVLRQAEVLAAPQVTPSWLTVAEVAALEELGAAVPKRVDPDNPAGRTGAGFGSALMNRRVELAAMKHVDTSFRDQRYTITNVSQDNCGWDMTAQRGSEVRRLEIKGVRGPEPLVLLTANEIAKAGDVESWELAVVTDALHAPRLRLFTAEQALKHIRPVVYSADLRKEAFGKKP